MVITDLPFYPVIIVDYCHHNNDDDCDGDGDVDCHSCNYRLQRPVLVFYNFFLL